MLSLPQLSQPKNDFDSIEAEKQLRRDLQNSYDVIRQKATWLLMLRYYARELTKPITAKDNLILQVLASFNIRTKPTQLMHIITLLNCWQIQLNQASIFKACFDSKNFHDSVLKYLFVQRNQQSISYIDTELAQTRQAITTKNQLIHNNFTGGKVKNHFLWLTAKLSSFYLNSIYHQFSATFINGANETLRQNPQTNHIQQSPGFKVSSILILSSILLAIDLFLSRRFLSSTITSPIFLQPIANHMTPNIDAIAIQLGKNNYSEKNAFMIYDLIQALSLFALYMILTTIVHQPSLFTLGIIAASYVFARIFVMCTQAIIKSVLSNQLPSKFQQLKNISLFITGYFGFLIANKIFNLLSVRILNYFWPTPELLDDETCPIESDILASSTACAAYPDICEQLIEERMGVSIRELTQGNINSHFRRQALKVHPDQNPELGDETYRQLVNARERAKEIAEINKTL